MASHDQLAKILGLLGSAHEGEVVNAARRAQDYLASRKLRWSDIIGGAPERRGIERRLLALREHARRPDTAFDKEEQTELKAVIREFTLHDILEPAMVRRLEWLEAIMEAATAGT